MRSLKNFILKLIYLLIFTLLLGCFSIIGAGIPKDIEYKRINYVGGNIYKIHYENFEVSVGINMGMCGGGVLFILGIPLPMSNTCEKNDFAIKVMAWTKNGQQKQKVFLKYNGVIHNSVRRPKKEILSTYIDRKFFEIQNFEEFKNARDKTIIIEEDGKIIAEIPFEWGVVFFLEPSNT